jgi:hypothetical protein
MRITGKNKKSRSALSVFLLFFAASAFAGAIAYFYFSWNDHLENSNIFSEGSRAIGIILAKSVGLDDSASKIEYTFTTLEGKIITNIQPDRLGKLYNKAQEGSSIEIAYNPANPNKNFPIELGVRSLSEIILDTALIALVGAAALAFWKHITSKKQPSI